MFFSQLVEVDSVSAPRVSPTLFGDLLTADTSDDNPFPQTVPILSLAGAESGGGAVEGDGTGP